MDDDTQVLAQPAPQDGQKRPPATWVVVALTLGAVLLLAGVFGAGFAVGRSTGDDTTSLPATGGADPSGGTSAPTPDREAADGLDECVVGTWRTTEHTETADTEQGRLTISGVVRTVEISPDGTETITYDGTPATLAVEEGGGEAIYDGTVTYGVATSGGTMTFDLRDVDATLTVRTANGQEKQQELQPGTGEVQYTCEGDAFTQTATGYRSVMERVE